MNKGIVIKYNAAQSYTTDGLSAALFKEICAKAKVPTQNFTNRADLRGGGTLGNISSAHVSLLSVDIGLAQLAMHSCYETAGVDDVKYMIDALKEFYSTSIRIDSSSITLE
jgi:aspartyl aminopeptidase